jgi:hypothetical protein
MSESCLFNLPAIVLCSSFSGTKSFFFTVAAAFFLAAPAAGESMCSAELYRTRIAVNAALAQHATAGPFAPESKAAKLSHQPTLSTIARAEEQFDKWPNGNQAVAALRRARLADERGDSERCLDALREANIAIGVRR